MHATRTTHALAFLLTVLLAAGWDPPAQALGTPPCSTVLAMPAINIIPLTNGSSTYCVSDYGWSDTWFVASAPARYDLRLDVFSGDDAPNLHFGIRGGDPWPVVSGFGWISPVIDGGLLEPLHLTASPWVVTTPVHFTAFDTTAESLLHHPAGMDLLITTSIDLVGQGITQTFVLTNATTDLTFEDIVLADYFNFHPNGSTAENFRKGTATYSPSGGIRITGPDDGTLIANGSMRGERVDDLHGTNASFPTVPDIAFDMVQTLTYPDPTLPDALFTAGPGDAAGGLAWRLEPLGPGERASFTVFKLAEPLLDGKVTAPAGLSLLVAAGLGALVASRGMQRRWHLG